MVEAGAQKGALSSFPEVWAVGDVDLCPFSLRCPPDHGCLTWFPDHVDWLPLVGKSGGKVPHIPVPSRLSLLPSTFAPHSPLSHRRPGILVLINDADWELLVSTSSDTPPQPLPFLLQ